MAARSGSHAFWPGRSSACLGPAAPSRAAVKRVFAVLLALAITAVAVAQYRTHSHLIPVAWLSFGPLLASLVLSPLVTAALSGWTVRWASGSS